MIRDEDYTKDERIEEGHLSQTDDYSEEKPETRTVEEIVAKTKADLYEAFGQVFYPHQPIEKSRGQAR